MSVTTANQSCSVVSNECDVNEHKIPKSQPTYDLNYHHWQGEAGALGIWRTRMLVKWEGAWLIVSHKWKGRGGFIQYRKGRICQVLWDGSCDGGAMKGRKAR